MKIEAEQLYEESKDELEEGSLLYIATDERNKSFFDPLKKHYQLAFLDDYIHLIEGVNPNYYGMLDQLVAYKGKVFFGTWFSTLSGYINRYVIFSFLCQTIFLACCKINLHNISSPMSSK